MKTPLTKEEIQMPNKHEKRCSKLLLNSKNQIKSMSPEKSQSWTMLRVGGGTGIRCRHLLGVGEDGQVHTL